MHDEGIQMLNQLAKMIQRSREEDPIWGSVFRGYACHLFASRLVEQMRQIGALDQLVDRTSLPEEDPDEPKVYN